MPENQPVTKKQNSPDWFLRGALTRIGDSLDRLTGRNWQPSSSIATSQLVDRLKALLDAEKKEVPGKGFVVPHNIKLKMQWDKFSSDEGSSLDKLRNELLIAAADHINDSLYYTYAPLHLEVKPDYFTEGVKLLVSFEQFDDENEEVEMNVTMPGIKLPAGLVPRQEKATVSGRLIARSIINGKPVERLLDLPADGRITVGRTATNGLMLDDISVSKVHASIAISDAGLSVADTGSTNGTFINGERIAYGKAVAFDESDKVTFGTVEVSFELSRPDEPESAESGDQDAVQVGDMTFRSRAAEAKEEEGDEQLPSTISASQLETQRIDPEPVPEAGATTVKDTE
jgi:pSer/pThr/pTyr-binding forkhead associated (FHA) protein